MLTKDIHKCQSYLIFLIAPGQRGEVENGDWYSIPEQRYRYPPVEVVPLPVDILSLQLKPRLFCDSVLGA